MPSPVRHASLESVWPWLPSVLLDCLCLCKSSRDSCAALIVTDGRQIRCQSPKRAEQLAALISTHFRAQDSSQETREALREVKLPLE